MDGRKRRREDQVFFSNSDRCPIKLFSTQEDRQKEQARTLHADTVDQDQCWTLRQMIGLDNSKKNDASITWIIISNFLVDFEFIIEEIPELLSVKTLIFYGVAENSPLPWKQLAGDDQFECVCLDPSAPVDSPHNPTGQQIPYGVHHSKFFLVGFDDQTIRVCIHTSNIRHSDIHLKAQAAFVQDFPLKEASSSRMSQFEETLISYIASYRYTKKHCWDNTTTKKGAIAYSLLDLLRRYDFSTAMGVLIPSTPGYHRLDSSQPRGHLKVRKAVADHASDKNLSSIVCQFSSMGSLNARFLLDLQRSMDAWAAKRKDVVDKKPLSLKLVYPTVQEIRSSVEGYAGGRSVPGSTKNVNKPFLRPLYHRWSSPDNSKITNRLLKPRNVPHMKSYFQLHSDNDSMSWFLVTSHNLSKAAWGEVQTSSRFGGRRLFIRHWELGAFVSPSLLNARRLKAWSPVIDLEDSGGDTVSIPLPYNIVPVPYSSTDTPWAVDSLHSEADSFGRTSAMDL